MSLAPETTSIILSLIGLLSIGALASPKPSQSALLLFLESILINFFLALKYGPASTIFAASVLLSFFAMIAIGSNYYFEISLKNSVTRSPKLNAAIGALLLILFWQKIHIFQIPQIENYNLEQSSMSQDSLSLVIALFALFAILVSALTIFDTKNSEPR